MANVYHYNDIQNTAIVLINGSLAVILTSKKNFCLFPCCPKTVLFIFTVTGSNDQKRQDIKSASFVQKTSISYKRCNNL